MSRELRMAEADETVTICEAGQYMSPSGRRVELAGAIRQAKAGTRLYSLQDLTPARHNPHQSQTRITVSDETTFSALQRLVEDNIHVACLNFASAKNPGGGFLAGAQAQEESLARASALYPCLLSAPEYYERNQMNRSAIYLDLVIYSPRVPFFRNDAGVLLEKPVLASVISAPAPNAGAVAQNEPRNMSLVASTLRRRAELILEIAVTQKVQRLVLGAWGCGVFRNDPPVVAATFAQLLKPPGRFAGLFQHVVFAVYDRTASHATFRAFMSALN